MTLLIKQLIHTVYVLVFGYILHFACKCIDKRTKEYKIWRKLMENSYDAIKSGVLLLEHFAMVVAGGVAGWFIARKKRKQSEKFLAELTKELKEANKQQQIQQALAEEKAKTKEKDVIKADNREMPYGKDFVKAIGEVWLYNNFFGRQIKR